MQFEDNYPLKNVTTLGIGGPAKKFVRVFTQEELIAALKYAKGHNLDFLVIGGGSNLLVADEGVDSLVIKNEITGIEQISHPGGVILKVKSGTLLQNLVNYTIHHGLSGLQKLTGIPGTVGGAIYGNAGAYGQTISNHLIHVILLNSSQDFKTLTKDECKFDYRGSIFKKTHDVILEVTFLLNPEDPKVLQQEAQDTLSKRLVKYPLGIKCPGSFFKNLVASEIPQEILNHIPKDKVVYGKVPAGALLEEVEAKGQTVNGIEIASYHGNLFINTGTGTAQAFYNLARTYALKVKQKYGIILEPEVQLINLPPLL